jgi:hypothetical protein
VAIGAHNDEIRAKGGSLREQKATHVFSFGRKPSYLHLRTMTRKVACNIRPRFLAVTRVKRMVNNQDLDRFGPHKEWQSVRRGPDCFPPSVPPH